MDPFLKRNDSFKLILNHIQYRGRKCGVCGAKTPLPRLEIFDTSDTFSVDLDQFLDRNLRVSSDFI